MKCPRCDEEFNTIDKMSYMFCPFDGVELIK